jgi:hypothetical protein
MYCGSENGKDEKGIPLAQVGHGSPQKKLQVGFLSISF